MTHSIALAPRRSSRELWLAFAACVAISLVYLFVTITWRAVPAASGLFGQSIGILGFLLMLMTESLYTLRKRSHNARWGHMSSWLEFHIFTGLVGPYMVLLHTSWKFNGLAGMVMLLTALTVASGFVGRYIYTAVPRTIEGIEIEAAELAEAGSLPEALQRQAKRLAAARRALAIWHVIHIPIGAALFTMAFIHACAAIYFATLLR